MGRLEGRVITGEERARAKRLEYLRTYRETHREEKRAYDRSWRRANPDKVKEYQARYWLRKAQETE